MGRDLILLRKKANFAILKKMFKSFMSLHDHTYFSFEDLERRGVRVSPFNISAENKATVPGEPQFFEPIPDSEFKTWPKPATYEPVYFEPESRGISDPRAIFMTVDGYLRDDLPDDVMTEEHYSLITFSKWFPGPLVP